MAVHYYWALNRRSYSPFGKFQLFIDSLVLGAPCGPLETVDPKWFDEKQINTLKKQHRWSIMNAVLYSRSSSDPYTMSGFFERLGRFPSAKDTFAVVYRKWCDIQYYIYQQEFSDGTVSSNPAVCFITECDLRRYVNEV